MRYALEARLALEFLSPKGMWFYAKEGEQHGPIEAGDLRNRVKSGELSNETLVWKEGMAQWAPMGEVLELRDPVPTATGPVTPTSAPAAATPEAVSPIPSPSPDSSPATTAGTHPAGGNPVGGMAMGSVPSAQATQSTQSTPSSAPSAPSAPQLVAPKPQNTMALVSMVLGFASFFFCVLTGIPAIICGHIAKRQFREAPVPQSGEGMATTGLILGYLCLIGIVVGTVAFFLLGNAWVEAFDGATSPTAAPLP